MECSLNAGRMFTVQFTERAEAAQRRAELSNINISLHPQQLRYIYSPIWEIKELESFFLHAKQKGKVKVRVILYPQ